MKPADIIDRIIAAGDPEAIEAAHKLIRLECRDRLYAFTRLAFANISPGEELALNWHLEAIAWRLERVERGEIRRLIITMPPRSLNSIFASVALPAWLLGRNPSKKIICVSYAQDLADKHARDCMALMQSAFYRGTFPLTLIDPRKAGVGEFATTRRGFRMATSIGGTLTGRGGDILIIDDPLKPQDAMSESQRTKTNAWYDNTLVSRLDDKTRGAIVIVTQRLHVDDLVGHVRESDGWECLNLPAIAEVEETIRIGPERYHVRQVGDLLHAAREPQHVLDSLKAQMGSQVFSAQFQQAPVPPSGNLIKREWLKYYPKAPSKQRGDYIVQSIDTAMKPTERSDYSVIITALISRDRCVILDVFRERLDYPDLRKAVIEHKERYSPDVVMIEDKGSGTSLLQDLEAERIHAIGIKPEGDKLLRMSAESVRFEQGAVYLPKQAAWLAEFEAELLAFPAGRHDDQVDALSQLLAWMRERPGLQIVGTMPVRWG